MAHPVAFPTSGETSNSSKTKTLDTKHLTPNPTTPSGIDNDSMLA